MRPVSALLWIGLILAAGCTREGRVVVRNTGTQTVSVRLESTEDLYETFVDLPASDTLEMHIEWETSDIFHGTLIAVVPSTKEQDEWYHWEMKDEMFSLEDEESHHWSVSLSY